VGRITNFLGSPKTIAATTAQTIVWTGNELPSQGLVAIHFATTGGANNSLANCMANRLRIKADSTTIFDVSLTAYQSWLQRFSQANLSPGNAVLAWSVWFNMLDIVDDDLADACQFPRGTVPTVELNTNASVAAGSAYIGWTVSDVEADYYPVLIGQAMNFAAPGAGTTENLSFPITEPGMLRGFAMPTVGLSRLRLDLSGAQYEYLPGALYQGTATGDMFRDAQAIEDNQSVTTTIWHRLYGTQAGLGASRVELAVGTTWGGVANEITTWAVRPQ